MLKIRLSRTGKKHEPHYKIVVVPLKSKRDGRVVAELGHWHPKQDQLVLNKTAYQEWIGKGAQASATVRGLLSK